MIDKEALRVEARRRLRSFAEDERAASGEEIARRLWTLPEVCGARTLLLYAALPEEVPTAAIADQARRQGIQLVYPRCLPRGREMTLHSVAAPHQLTLQGRYGIHEPEPSCPRVAPEEIDVALVPGLAWDRSGRRLGRGAGYYDRLLDSSAWRALRCGLFFSFQEVPAIPPDPWDQPLHVVLTELEEVRIPRNLGS